MPAWLSIFARFCSCGRRGPAVYPAAQDNAPVTLLLLGLDNSGKSTVLERLRKEKPKDLIAPTWGFVAVTLKPLSAKLPPMRVFDVGGHDRIRGIWANYYAETHGIVFVVDGTDVARFAEAYKVLHAAFNDARVKGKPLLLLINKRDKQGYQGRAATLAALGVRDIAGTAPTAKPSSSTDLAAHVFEISATHAAQNGQAIDAGLQIGFHHFLQQIGYDRAALDPRVTADTAAQRKAYEVELEQRRSRISVMREEKEKEREKEKASAAAAQDSETAKTGKIGERVKEEKHRA
ncbi:ADP-ribosylation factor-like protein 13B [Allomyces javanicus]|nr:ADP-ribosylation factor-like protein 13B [Allomyces javanicus]